MTSPLPKEERVAIRRALKLLKLDKPGFAWSVAAGSAGLMSSVGLAAVSAWLIARASQMPPVLDLSVAATSVRALGVGKAVFRYLNQIASHRVALYGMSELRSAVYNNLADSPTDVVTSVRRGDLLTRTGRDVDAVGDLVVRALQPAVVALVVSIFAVGIVGALSPAIGMVLALGLLISGVVGPFFAMRGARLAEEAQIRDKAELAAQSLTMLESASELRVSGQLNAMEKAVAATERRIFRNRDHAARPAATAVAIDLLAFAITVVLSIIIGTMQVGAGTLKPVELAVVVLTPLAAFEATQALSNAGIQLVRSGKAAQRIFELLDAANKKRDIPPRPADIEESGLTVRDLVIGWPDGPDVAGAFSFDVERGHSLAIVGASGMGKPPSFTRSQACSTHTWGTCGSTARKSPISAARRSLVHSFSQPRTRISLSPRCLRTFVSLARISPLTKPSKCWDASDWAIGLRNSHRGSIPISDLTPQPSPAGNGAGCFSRVPLPLQPSIYCSTNQASTWTLRRLTPSFAIFCGQVTTTIRLSPARSFWSLTDSNPSTPQTASCCLARRMARP